MIALRDEGKIAGIGISTAPLAEVAGRLVGDHLCPGPVQPARPDDGGVLQHCIDNGIAFVPYFPLGSAFPGMPKVTDDARSGRRRADGATPAQVGLAWFLAGSRQRPADPGYLVARPP